MNNIYFNRELDQRHNELQLLQLLNCQYMIIVNTSLWKFLEIIYSITLCKFISCLTVIIDHCMEINLGFYYVLLEIYTKFKN